MCNENGGNLASIHSSEENQFVLSMGKAIDIKANFWIGGSDIKNEGEWVWTDGSAFDYKFWGGNNPSNSGGNEDCISFWLIDKDQKWNDFRCDNDKDHPRHATKGFVCKKKV